jgi:hypothetical protein
MTYFYLYRTTNLINGKIYVGVHKTSNLEDGYIGSGKVLNRAIEKYGIENFRKDILEFFDTAKEMFAKEKEIVTEEFLLREDTYNLKHGGFGGFDYVNKVTDSAAKSKAGKMGRAKGIERGTLKIGFTAEETQRGRENYRKLYNENKEFRQSIREAGRRANKLSQAPEVRARVKETYKEIKHQQGTTNSQYGTMWITNGIDNKKIKSTDTIPEGWSRGRKVS